VELVLRAIKKNTPVSRADIGKTVGLRPISYLLNYQIILFTSISK